MHCSPDFGEHLHDHYFEFFIRWITYLPFIVRSGSGVLSCSFVQNIGLFLHFLWLCVGFCIFSKTASSPVLTEGSCVGEAPEVLAISETSVIYPSCPLGPQRLTVVEGTGCVRRVAASTGWLDLAVMSATRVFPCSPGVRSHSASSWSSSRGNCLVKSRCVPRGGGFIASLGQNPGHPTWRCCILSIHQLMDIGPFALFGYYEQCCYEHSYATFHMDLFLPLLDAYEWNCWVPYDTFEHFMEYSPNCSFRKVVLS